MLEDIITINNNNKYCCNACNKHYTRKLSLDKHKILCDFKHKTKREHQIEFEELGDIPNHIQLVKIVQELTFKLIKMDEKMEEMQKWVEKKKKKLNVIVWLNSNIVPTIGFLEWVNTMFVVEPEHFEYLMESNLFQTIQQVFEYNLSKKDDFICPVRCFVEKKGIFYICENNHDGTVEWKQLELSEMILILKIFQNRMIKEITKWKLTNQYNFDDNTKMSNSFNRAIIKLMNLTFTQDANLTRIKNGLYNYLKTNLKYIIESEFEF